MPGSLPRKFMLITLYYTQEIARVYGEYDEDFDILARG